MATAFLLLIITDDMKNFELLAPAGNFDKLKTALYYGADAVYVGGTIFSLRALSENFNREQLREAVEYTHVLLCCIFNNG